VVSRISREGRRGGLPGQGPEGHKATTSSRTDFDGGAAVVVRGAAPSARLAADAHATMAPRRGTDHGAHGTLLLLLLLGERRARGSWRRSGRGHGVGGKGKRLQLGFKLRPWWAAAAANAEFPGVPGVPGRKKAWGGRMQSGCVRWNALPGHTIIPRARCQAS